MYSTLILPLAKQDIHIIAKWYNKRKSGLGKRFTSEIKSQVNFISKNPKACAIKYGEIRTTLVAHFPYMIHFYLDETHQKVIITAVFGTSESPTKWKLNR